ncbi:MAG: TIM barrel protein [candidate division KSB1 bacterium]|nr:TIM barrel protein [candidate division KSB1 bacterium]
MKQQTRRTFLKESGAVIAATALLGCQKKESTRSAAIPLGVQLYSVRKECEQNLPATLEAVAKIGYQGVEFAGFYNYSAKELKALLDANGLKCCGSHTPFDALQPENFEATVAFNHELGNKYLICPWLPEERRKTIDQWKELAAFFNELAEKAKPHGMRIGYHNHHFEFQNLDGELPWDVFAAHTREDVILQLDTGNAASGGADAYQTLIKYPKRAVTIHLKEFSQSNPNAVLGEGDIPWKDVFTFCETQGGTEWYIIEEEKEIYPPLVAIERCYKNFQALKG